VHIHQWAPRGKVKDSRRDEIGKRFGSLLTSGPFPVNSEGQWFFPTPTDILVAKPISPLKHSLEPSVLPLLRDKDFQNSSSIPNPLKYALASRISPGKDNLPKEWISKKAFEAYLSSDFNEIETDSENSPSVPWSVNSREFSDTEHSIGVGIDPDSGTVRHSAIYSAHYLRLRDHQNWGIGLLATGKDKGLGDESDLIDLLFQKENGRSTSQILVGGQQRVCSVQVKECDSPVEYLPSGPIINSNRVKWILLTPAIFPHILPHPQKNVGNEHPGGWLPNWICPDTGEVKLKAGDSARKEGESRKSWRERVQKMSPVKAKLVAASVGKPVPVTGWSLGDANHPETPERSGGAKSTLLAVPAGSIYYFEADNPEEAQKLTDALNWHGSSTAAQEKNDNTPIQIRNRRSTLMGEKGFGLGVCGPWKPFDEIRG